MNPVLPYDPGVLPTLPAPKAGEQLQIELAGLPPPKDLNKSIRNRSHPFHQRFLDLRAAATTAMAGRAWVFGRVHIRIAIRGPERKEDFSLNDYLGGVMDTLDGSCGRTFTFLPIVYEDDHQIWASEVEWEDSPQYSDSLHVLFK